MRLALLLLVALAPAALAQQPAPLPQDSSALAGRIAARLTAALKDPCLVTATTAVTVRDASTGALIFERNGATPMKPASNMKLLTAAAAQDVLGPERSLETAFRGDRTPDSSGGVGKLYVVGGGDPSLTIESLYLAARALAMRGVRRVDGIVVDDSFFSGPIRPPSWPERNHSAWYGAPSAALGANFNVVAVHVRGGAKTGEPAATWLDPFPTFFDLATTTRTGAGGISAKGSLIVRPDGSTAQRLAVSGRVRARKTVRVLVPVEDPALFCGHGVAESLRRAGVEVSGIVARGTAPQGAPLLHEHRGKPIADVVRDMNKPSSNVYAETLLKVLGAELHGPPGTREKGVEVLRAWAELVSPGCDCLFADGSGLSPDNRLSARMLTDLLLAQSGSASYPEYLTSLPVSGADGTLRRRFRGTHATRLVRAKTGRISQVAALSGIAEIGEGRRAVFSILVNGYHCPSWKAEAAVDRAVEALVADAPAAVDARTRLNLRPLPDEPADEADEASDGADTADESAPEAGDGATETTDGPEEQQPPPG